MYTILTVILESSTNTSPPNTVITSVNGTQSKLIINKLEHENHYFEDISTFPFIASPGMTSRVTENTPICFFSVVLGQ